MVTTPDPYATHTTAVLSLDDRSDLLPPEPDAKDATGSVGAEHDADASSSCFSPSTLLLAELGVLGATFDGRRWSATCRDDVSHKDLVS